ncbi:MAG: DUF975 family protein [Bacillota bacterium]
MDLSINKIKRKARFHLSGNGFNIAVLMVTFMALHLALLMGLRFIGMQVLFILEGPIFLGMVIYILAVVRMEKEPSKKKDQTFIQRLVSIGFLAESGVDKKSKKFKINLENMQNPYQVKIAAVLYGFKYFLKSAALFIWVTLLTLVWSLLLVVPGIIKMIDMSMSFFILADKPSIDIREAVVLSEKMMKDHRKKFFLLNLSFIGWIIFSLISFSIGFIITIPYMMASYAIFYDELKRESIKKGIIAEDEIGNMRIWEY